MVDSYTFPSFRRRPLRSRTYDILVQILSHCRTGSAQLKSQVDSSNFESIPVSEKEESITHNEASADVRESFPNRNGSKNMIPQENSNNENTELYHTKLVTGVEPEVAPLNRISVEDYMVVENLMGDCAIQDANEQENLISVHDIQIGDFEVDKEICMDNVNELFESCFGVDEKSSEGQESRHRGIILESKPKDAEQELQLKEMELEKLIDNSGHPNADEEMEEGEISGEAGVSSELFDVLSDNVTSHEKRTTEKMHASDDHFDNVDEGHLQNETFDHSVVNSGSSSLKMERRATAGQMQDCLSQNILHENHMETQRSGAITPFLENLTPSGRILQENSAENQIPSTAENGDCPSKNKRKRRGALTQEKQEKKKKKKRLKRAAKNRELGVKRLKLQPVFKEKKIVYCRHYLQGRCHEGEKCKFSHDTVPLTKSKPCSHFARHSCMKGDECPYDHQLSNYPCTNYASNGFCIRGSDCLFSHKIPAKSCSISPNVPMSDKGGSDPKSKITKPELKFLSPLNNSNSSKHMDNLRVLNQKVDAIIYSSSNLPSKTAPRTVVHPPRGVSFLSNKGKPAGDTSKEKRDESSTKTSHGVNAGSDSILKVPGGISQLSEVSEGAAPRKPKGINFLAFGELSSSTRGIIADLRSGCNSRADKSVIDDAGILKANRQMNASATTNLTSGLNKKVISTPLIVPQHVSSLSGNRSSLDDSISKETARFHLNRSYASSFVKGREITSKLQGTFKSPSLAFGGLWDQSTGGQNASSSSPFYLNATPQVQKAIQSTMAFVAKLELNQRKGSSASS